MPAALCSSGTAGPGLSRSDVDACLNSPATAPNFRSLADVRSSLRFSFAPSRQSFPFRTRISRFFWIHRNVSGVAPRVIRARFLLDRVACSVTDPPPGIVAAWPTHRRRSPFNVLWRCSATLMGFLLTALRSFHPAVRVFSTSVATLPRAVEPRATRDVFGVRHRCRGPAAVLDGLGPISFKLRLLGFSPAGQPFSCIGAAPPRLGYEGPLRSTNRFCPGLLLFRASRPSDPGSPLPGPIRSWALSSRRSAILRKCAPCFHHATPPISPAPRRRPSAF